MSPEMIGILFAPSGIVALVIGLIARYVVKSQDSRHKKQKRDDDSRYDKQKNDDKARHDKLKKDMAIIKARHEDEISENENFRALIEIIADNGKSTAKLAESIGKMDDASHNNANKLETAIYATNGKLERLDKTFEKASGNFISELEGMQSKLEEMAETLTDNKLQHVKFEGLISDFEELVSKLNVITDAKEKTQPIPNLEEILANPNTTISSPPTPKIEDNNGDES